MGISRKDQRGQRTSQCTLSVILLALSLGIHPVLANEPAGVDACIPGRGWNWTTGPADPRAAFKAEAALTGAGILAEVRAFAFGEEDDCGNFQPHSTDFWVDLPGLAALSDGSRAALADRILPLLADAGGQPVGNVRVNYGDGVSKVFQDPFSDIPVPTHPGQWSSEPAPWNKNVFLLVFDPLMSNGQDLNTYLGWQPYPSLVQSVIDTFKAISANRLNYAIAHTVVVSDHWPVGIDGHQYTEEEYLNAYYTQTPYEPAQANYDVILSNPTYDICGRLNRGEIDELWILNAPYMGFAESRLAGPDGYWFNSDPLEETHGCTRLLPMMGISYERALGEAIEDFGHRTEATMTRVYGGWRADSILTNWERFSLSKARAPSFSFSGCGGIHYAPNSVKDYDYGNHNSVLSYCADFLNYPNLGDPLSMALPVRCEAWGCSQVGYFAYWFGHFPAFSGCNMDGTINDWWQYFIHPDLARTPFLPCPPPPCPTITQWKGEYWNNVSLTGSPTLCRNDPTLLFDWLSSSPDPIIPIENFSARWTRTVDFEAGSYIFSLAHDDGGRLYIDDVLALDGWGTSCTIEATQVTLPAGPHNLRVEMFERGGGAGVSLWWEPETINGWRGEYYNNENLGGRPVFVRDDPDINYDWGSASPDPMILADHFSVHWSRILHFDGGRYLFKLFRDDGIRLKIDGEVLLEAWQPGRGWVTAVGAMSQGEHYVEVDAYDAAGTAAARFGYAAVIPIFLPVVTR